MGFGLFSVLSILVSGVGLVDSVGSACYRFLADNNDHIVYVNIFLIDFLLFF